ncbi:DUF5709 domain-containing protein [Vallicoccus soli]|uniref:DUF5709 domain-containing protein n=1 Tax=Vallicoccus soli TaxID=2339232 RepID=A0A3A3Z846_9ACTN|nr:DUF5709 domain-containing protein [Vallicoccus soli]RJK97007.1 hypothetical protein D5H78_07175 [Vallicoccus soli]
MTDPSFEDRPIEQGFPEVVDDDSPERDRYPEPEEGSLPGSYGYLGSDSKGTTVQEELEGETLDERLAAEEPEPYVDPLGSGEDDRVVEGGTGPGGGDPVGQLVAPDGDAEFDTEKDEVAYEEGSPGGGSPEEQAMHLEPEEG